LFDLFWPRGKKKKKKKKIKNNKKKKKKKKKRERKKKKNFLHFHFPLDSIPEIKIFPFYLNLNF